MQRTPVEVIIAPPLLRIAAFLFDLGLLVPVNLGLATVLIGGIDPKHPSFEGSLIATITQAIYSIVFVSLFRATPGKMVMRMRIARLDGQPLMPDTAILRHLVYMVGTLPFGIGVIASTVLLLVDPARRTIHDRVAGTIVALKLPDAQRRPP